MEFPLFPVFLRAAVQTPPVSHGAGQDWGSQPVYPSPTWQPLRESRALRHMACWAFMGRRATRVCLFSTSSLSSSLAYFLWSFSIRNKHTLGFSQMADPLNIIRIVYSALVSSEASTGVVHQWGWQYTGGQFSASSACLFHFSVCTFGFTLLVHWFQTSVIVYFQPSAQVWRCTKPQFTDIKIIDSFIDKLTHFTHVVQISGLLTTMLFCSDLFQNTIYLSYHQKHNGTEQQHLPLLCPFRKRKKRTENSNISEIKKENTEAGAAVSESHGSQSSAPETSSPPQLFWQLVLQEQQRDNTHHS